MANKIFITLILLLLGVGITKFYLKTTGISQDEHDLAENSLKSVIVYSREGCGYCDLAKELLAEKGIKFESVELSNNYDLAVKLVNQTGQKTVPYIYIDGKFIGGYQNLKNLVDSGKIFK